MSTASMPVLNGDPREIAMLSESLRLLAEAKTIDEVKNIRDKAEALRLYVKQQGESLEVQNVAAEIKIRAERRAGNILLDMEFAKGGGDQKSDHRFHDGTSDPCTLKSLGIDKKQSHRWQKIASVPDEDFERHIIETKATPNAELTSSGVRRLASKLETSSEPKVWSLDDAIEYLGSKLHEIASRWPADRLEVMVHQLRSLSDELLEYGELRE